MFAQRNLGSLYLTGRGVKQDYQKAKELYEKAANQGFDEALNILGGMYYNGEGIKQDYIKAKEFYEKAANKGNVESQYLHNRRRYNLFLL